MVYDYNKRKKTQFLGVTEMSWHHLVSKVSWRNRSEEVFSSLLLHVPRSQRQLYGYWQDQAVTSLLQSASINLAYMASGATHIFRPVDVENCLTDTGLHVYSCHFFGAWCLDYLPPLADGGEINVLVSGPVCVREFAQFGVASVASLLLDAVQRGPATSETTIHRSHGSCEHNCPSVVLFWRDKTPRKIWMQIINIMSKITQRTKTIKVFYRIRWFKIVVLPQRLKKKLSSQSLLLNIFLIKVSSNRFGAPA